MAVRERRAADRVPAAPDDGWRAYLWLWLLASAVFFTPAGNILPTYVLPAMPAFALLVAEAWTAMVDAGRGQASTKYCGVAMPVLMVVAVLFGLPRIAPNFSHKGLVADYLARRANGEQALVYLGEPPLSAEFYTGGRAARVETAADIERRFGRGDFFVISDGDLASAPALKGHLLPIARSGRWQLLQERAPAASQ